MWVSSNPQVLMADRQPRYSLLKPKLDVFEIPEFKYIGRLWTCQICGGLGPGDFEGVKHFRAWWGWEWKQSRRLLSSRLCLETTLTFDPWKLLFFFGSEKVDVNELLGSVGSFRCWPNREVEPSCITITCQRNSNKPNWSQASLLWRFCIGTQL